MQFDPAGSAQSIPDMIKNDTLIEVLDQDQLCECLKYIVLNNDDSLYILDKIQSKYKVPDRFKAIRHILVDFGEGSEFDSKKFVGFIRSLCRCIHLDILDSIASITESAFSKIDQLSAEIKQNTRILDTRSDIQTQTQQESTSQTQNESMNKNIEKLKNTPKTEENFDKIYEICEKIADEKDKEAMSFAIRENFVYVTKTLGFRNYNIFTKAAKDRSSMIQLLIDSGIDINTRDKTNSTVLIAASISSSYEVVKLLLTVPGIDVNAKDIYNQTVLICALREGHHEVVKLLLTDPGIDVNAKNEYNNTVLILASQKGRHEVVKLLLSIPKIDVNAKNVYNRTALMDASVYGHHEVVKLLLTIPGIDVNTKDVYNSTALCEASQRGYHEIVKMLKDHGAI